MYEIVEWNFGCSLMIHRVVGYDAIGGVANSSAFGKKVILWKCCHGFKRLLKR